VLDCAFHNQASLIPALTMIAYYLHLGDFAQFVIKDVDRQIEALNMTRALLFLLARYGRRMVCWSLAGLAAWVGRRNLGNPSSAKAADA